MGEPRGTKRLRERGVTRDESARSTVAVLERESVRWHAHLHVDKFGIDQVMQCAEYFGLDREPIGPELLEWAAAVGAAPDEALDVDGNLLTRLGLARIGNVALVSTATWVGLSATRARIGLGDDATAAATTQTDLSGGAGSTHRQFKLVDSIAQGTGANSGVTTAIATFSTGVANFAVAEWCIDGGTADGTTVTSDAVGAPGMINRKVAALGTKTSAQVWVVTATITIA